MSAKCELRGRMAYGPTTQRGASIETMDGKTIVAARIKGDVPDMTLWTACPVANAVRLYLDDGKKCSVTVYLASPLSWGSGVSVRVEGS